MSDEAPGATLSFNLGQIAPPPPAPPPPAPAPLPVIKLHCENSITQVINAIYPWPWFYFMAKAEGQVITEKGAIPFSRIIAFEVLPPETPKAEGNVVQLRPVQ